MIDKNERIHFTGNHGMVYVMAVRYALGRNTFSPCYVIEETKEVLTELPDSILEIILTEIEHHLFVCKTDHYYDVNIDIWRDFDILINEELKRRSEEWLEKMNFQH